MKKYVALSLATLCFTLSLPASADMQVQMYDTNNSNALVGTITLSQTKYGVLFTPDLHGVAPGVHGFHIHENPSCEDSGTAAGPHLDPMNTNQHAGPYKDNSHLGDLPSIYVTTEGLATTPVLAPRIKSLKEVEDHSLMIHAGGDNYADKPEKLGGGGARMVCGVIK